MATKPMSCMGRRPMRSMSATATQYPGSPMAAMAMEPRASCSSCASVCSPAVPVWKPKDLSTLAEKSEFP